MTDHNNSKKNPHRITKILSLFFYLSYLDHISQSLYLVFIIISIF